MPCKFIHVLICAAWQYTLEVILEMNNPIKVTHSTNPPLFTQPNQGSNTRKNRYAIKGCRNSTFWILLVFLSSLLSIAGSVKADDIYLIGDKYGTGDKRCGDQLYIVSSTPGEIKWQFDSFYLHDDSESEKTASSIILKHQKRQQNLSTEALFTAARAGSNAGHCNSEPFEFGDVLKKINFGKIKHTPRTNRPLPPQTTKQYSCAVSLSIKAITLQAKDVETISTFFEADSNADNPSDNNTDSSSDDDFIISSKIDHLKRLVNNESHDDSVQRKEYYFVFLDNIDMQNAIAAAHTLLKNHPPEKLDDIEIKRSANSENKRKLKAQAAKSLQEEAVSGAPTTESSIWIRGIALNETPKNTCVYFVAIASQNKFHPKLKSLGKSASEKEQPPAFSIKLATVTAGY